MPTSVFLSLMHVLAIKSEKITDLKRIVVIVAKFEGASGCCIHAQPLSVSIFYLFISISVILALVHIRLVPHSVVLPRQVEW